MNPPVASSNASAGAPATARPRVWLVTGVAGDPGTPEAMIGAVLERRRAAVPQEARAEAAVDEARCVALRLAAPDAQRAPARVGEEVQGGLAGGGGAGKDQREADELVATGREVLGPAVG